AHAAVTAGRQAAAGPLREGVRQRDPAALPGDLAPAAVIPPPILAPLPDPPSRPRETSLVAELTASGVPDATTAVTAIGALRAAVEESRGWNGNRMSAPGVARH